MSLDGGGEPSGDLVAAIGDFAAFKDEFTQAGITRFGSGWRGPSGTARTSRSCRRRIRTAR